MLFQRVTGERRVRRISAVALLSMLAVYEASAQSSSHSDPSVAQGSVSAQPTSASVTGWFPEPTLIAGAMDFVVDRFGDGSDGTNSGFFVELSNMNSGAGWVSAGPGYRQYLFDEGLLLEGSAALSWHLYKMVQGRVELPRLAGERLTVGLQAMWQDQTQVDYFGRGPDSAEADRSQYRIRTGDVVGYATWGFTDWLAANGELGWLHRPKLGRAGGTFVGDYPDTRELFPDQPGAGEAFQPHFTHGELGLTADTRDHKGHPTRGGLYRATLTSYRDQGRGRFALIEYEAEAVHFVTLTERGWVLVVRGWTLLSDVSAGHEVPFYLQPSIGGSNTLRGYDSYRFHDLNTLVVNAESRWAVFEHVDVATFVDAGNVAARAGDLSLAKTSYGAGVRLHTSRTTVARLDVAHGSEGWRFVARTNDPFRLSRLSRRIARVPFAP
jgi:hypothetical protein